MGLNLLKKNIQKKFPWIVPYLLMIQRRSFKPVCDWSQDHLVKGVMNSYARHMGYRFDIKRPRSFTEKLQWYKVFYHYPNVENITDKFLFKKYIKQHVGDGYTIPLLGSWTTVEDIEKDWDRLPEEFVLKANLQSDGRNIMIIHNKSDIKFRKIRSRLKSWLDLRNTLKNSFDCNTYQGTPRILAEEYMANFEDQLYDYKFFCFNGKLECVYVAQDHFGKDGSYISFYDLDWNKLHVQYGNHKIGDAPKPKHFDEMKRIAMKLSKGFPFIRVDFFDTEDQLYIAELTFNPGGGCTKYYPEEYNNYLGDIFILPQI